MCGRYASFLPAEAVARLFHTVNPLPNVAASWNLAPTQDAMLCGRDGHKRLRFRYGKIQIRLEKRRVDPRGCVA
jgi:putative SOS response-associated peptidase YedK